MTRPASLLHPASYAHCWVCTWMGLLTCWLGVDQVGLEPSPVLTYWVTTTNFMSFRPIPRFRAYLGATSAWFGVVHPKTTLEQAVDLDLGELGGGRPKVNRLQPLVPWGRHELLPHRPSDENPGVPGRQTGCGALAPKGPVEVIAPEIGPEGVQHPL